MNTKIQDILPTPTFYQPLSKVDEFKLLLKLVALNIYSFVLNILSHGLNFSNISSHRLNQHLFKINILCRYASVENGSRNACHIFNKYLKIPTLNLPKMEIVLEESDLKKAHEHLLQFHADCNTNFDCWYSNALDDFLVRMNDIGNTKWKEEALADKEGREIQLKRFDQIADFQHPLNGVCLIVVAKIFQKLKHNQTLDLVSIVAKYKNGVGKTLAGLGSFHDALWQSWWSLEKIFPQYKAFASQEAVNFHTLNRLGISQKLVSEVKEKYVNDFNEPVQKINELKDGCYHLEIVAEKYKGQIHHSIFLHKQANQIEIVDPNIGLLGGANNQETDEMIEKLLRCYVKKNYIYNLFFHQMD